jgi:hypothetical protein
MYVSNRVTRLGGFSPLYWTIVNFGQHFIKQQKTPYFRANFFHHESYVLILAKMSWAIFWAIFSQTNMVTLVSRYLDGDSLKKRSKCSGPLRYIFFIFFAYHRNVFFPILLAHALANVGLVLSYLFT